MAERRRSSQSGRGGSGSGGKGSKSRSSSSGGSARSSARKSSASSRSSSSRSASSRKAAARKGGKARGRQQRARSQAKRTADTASGPAREVSAKSAAELRDVLRKNLIQPLHLVMLTRDRIEEVLADAVSRGRMTTDDAQNVAAGLLELGRKQTNDVLKDLEQLLGRGRHQVEGPLGKARARAASAAEPVLAQADRARRAAGVGPSFPILGYDDLTAAQVEARLTDLTPAELRKVRDYERRNANRKTVLSGIEEKLS
jgi:polyhydroxyalkanoate synthesis regulator phasin